jgi:hypothetical protein
MLGSLDREASFHAAALIAVFAACSSPDAPIAAVPSGDASEQPDATPTCTAASTSRVIRVAVADNNADDKHLHDQWIGFNSEIVGDHGITAGDSVFTTDADDLAHRAEKALGTSNAALSLFHPWLEGGVLRVPGGYNSDAYSWQNAAGTFPPAWVSQLGMNPSGGPALTRGKGGVPPGAIATLLQNTGTSSLWVYNIAPFKDASGNVTNPVSAAAAFMTSNVGLSGDTWGHFVKFWELNNEPWALQGIEFVDGGGYISRAKEYHDAMAPNTNGRFLVASGGTGWNNKLIAGASRCWWDGVVVHPYLGDDAATSYSRFRSDVTGWLKREFDRSDGEVAAIQAKFAQAYSGQGTQCSDIYLTEMGLLINHIHSDYLLSEYAGIAMVEAVLRFDESPWAQMVLMQKLISQGNGVVQTDDYHTDSIATAGVHNLTDPDTAEPHPAGYYGFYLTATGVLLSVAFPAWTAATDSFTPSWTDTETVQYTNGPGGASGDVDGAFVRLYETCVDASGHAEWCTTSGSKVSKHFLVVTNKAGSEAVLKFTLNDGVPGNGKIRKFYAVPTTSGEDQNSSSAPATVSTNGAGCVEPDSAGIRIPPYGVVRLEW